MFIVFFPAIVIANRRAGYRRRMYAWDFVLEGSPRWMRYMFYFFSAYAVLNFTFFILQRASMGPSAMGSAPTLTDWRGFSGHWMAFYSCAFVILFSALRRTIGNTCPSGHPFPTDSKYCPSCGQPLSPPH
jgi:hypothetical protein